jgi:signal peptidase I
LASTLEVDDRIFVNLLVPGPFDLARGDVVVFRDTKVWLPAKPAGGSTGPVGAVSEGLTFLGLLPDTSEQHLVKRIIGLPGDHVVCCSTSSQVTVNGATLNETYIDSAEPARAQDFDVIVPDGKIWVMGDNRNHSADSRSHMDADGGFIDLADVEGKAAITAWPLDRLKVLDNYPDVFKHVPGPESR